MFLPDRGGTFHGRARRAWVCAGPSAHLDLRRVREEKDDARAACSARVDTALGATSCVAFRDTAARRSAGGPVFTVSGGGLRSRRADSATITNLAGVPAALTPVPSERLVGESLDGADELGGVPVLGVGLVGTQLLTSTLGALLASLGVSAGKLAIQTRKVLAHMRRDGIEAVHPHDAAPSGAAFVERATVLPYYVDAFGRLHGPDAVDWSLHEGWRYVRIAAPSPMPSALSSLPRDVPSPGPTPPSTTTPLKDGDGPAPVAPLVPTPTDTRGLDEDELGGFFASVGHLFKSLFGIKPKDAAMATTATVSADAADAAHARRLQPRRRKVEKGMKRTVTLGRRRKD